MEFVMLSGNDIKFLQTGYKQLQKQDYQSSLQFIIQIKDAEKYQQAALIYWILAEDYYHLKFIDKSLQNIESGLKWIETHKKKSQYFNIYFKLVTTKIYLLMHKNDLEQAKLLCEQIKQEVQDQQFTNLEEKNQYKDNQYLIKQQIEEKILELVEYPLKQDINDQRKLLQEQYSKVQEIIKQNSETKYFENPSWPVFLIPMIWYNKWKDMCGNGQEQPDDNQGSGKKEDVNLEDQQLTEEQRQKKNEEELKKKLFEREPIDISEICETMENPLLDTEILSTHTNIFLKQGLREGQDFVAVSKEAFKILYEYFGGLILTRQIIENYDNDTKKSACLIEFNLQRLKLIVLPIIQRNQDPTKINQIYNIQVSKKDKVQDVEEKIRRSLYYCMNTYEAQQERIYIPDPTNSKDIKPYPCQLWKLESADYQEESEKIFKSYKQRQENVSIKLQATKMGKAKTIDELDISENNLVVVEFKLFKKWVFSNGDENQADDNQVHFCANCGTEGNNLRSCACQKVYYCDEDCQKQDYRKHKPNCTYSKNSQKQNSSQAQEIDSLLELFKLSKNNNPQPKNMCGVVGLHNLGNTCFMNSSLQCMSNIPELTSYLLGDSFIKDINNNNPIGVQGYLACAYAELIREMWQGKSQSVSPLYVKKVISKFAPQFSGMNQQDSQELLSYLLDGLHEDLNRVKEKPSVETVESDGKQQDEEVATKTWKFYKMRNDSIIIDLIAGQFKSTIICPQCSKVSVTFDPFMTLSLPIQQLKPQRLELYYYSRNPQSNTKKIEVTMLASHKLTDLRKCLQENLKVDEDKQKYFFIKSLRNIKSPNEEDTIEAIESDPRYLFCIETYDKNIDTFDYNDPAKLEIEFQTLNSENIQASFTKYFFVLKTFTIQQFYTRVYTIYRQNIINYMKVQSSSVQIFKDILSKQKFENANSTQEILIAELQAFLDSNSMPFTLAIQIEVVKSNSNQNLQIQGQQDQKKYKMIEIEYSSSTFGKQLKEIEEINSESVKSIQLELKFSKEYITKELKLINAIEVPLTINNITKQQRQTTIYNCLDLFIKKEFLEKGNEWFCSVCKNHQLASKKMDLYKLPKILILHLKRFKTAQGNLMGKYFFQMNSHKISVAVDYPVDELDLTKYCTSRKEGEEFKYQLIGVSNHFGGTQGGHYTAYARNHVKKQWINFDDSHTQVVDSSEVVNSDAYVLFYQRIQSNK